jgi:hypothetical protein
MESKKTRGGIADLYFYEELCRYIGQESSHQWLIDQNCSRSRRKVHGLMLGNFTQTACPERVRSAPSTPVGRDVPNARTPLLKQNSKTSCETKRSCLDIQSGGNCKSGISVISGRGIRTESLKFLMELGGPMQISGSVGFGLKRSESFERDVCLLFTDAAHKVLD